jgi:RibD C-terminal domain
LRHSVAERSLGRTRERAGNHLQRRCRQNPYADLLGGVSLDGYIVGPNVGGADVASSLTAHRLIDEYRLFVSPVVLASGKRFFAGENAIDLELLEPHLQLAGRLPAISTRMTQSFGYEAYEERVT